MNTNRRFPRTINEAFPGSAEYACSIERPYKAKPKVWLRVIVATMLAGFITLLVNIGSNQIT